MSAEEAAVFLPDAYGFCGGVRAADEFMKRVSSEAQNHGIPVVYGLHKIVHNKIVTDWHEGNGVVFVDDVDSIPPDSLVVTSAHGVGPEVIQALEAKGATVFDAACSLVVHTHRGVEQARLHDEKVLYVCHGKPGEVENLHDEVAGMIGHLNAWRDKSGKLHEEPVERTFLELGDDPSITEGLLSERARYRIITQTTLNATEAFRYREELREYILSQQPDAQVEWSQRGYVCSAVADRQVGVELSVKRRPRSIAVVTDPHSANGKSYVDLAKRLVAEEGLDIQVYSIANAEEAKALGLLEGPIALTASASTPDATIDEVIDVLGRLESPRVKDRAFQLRAAEKALQDWLPTVIEVSPTEQAS